MAPFRNVYFQDFNKICQKYPDFFFFKLFCQWSLSLVSNQRLETKIKKKTGGGDGVMIRAERVLHLISHQAFCSAALYLL